MELNLIKSQPLSSSSSSPPANFKKRKRNKFDKRRSKSKQSATNNGNANSNDSSDTSDASDASDSDSSDSDSNYSSSFKEKEKQRRTDGNLIISNSLKLNQKKAPTTTSTQSTTELETQKQKQISKDNMDREKEASLLEYYKTHHPRIRDMESMGPSITIPPPPTTTTITRTQFSSLNNMHPHLTRILTDETGNFRFANGATNVQRKVWDLLFNQGKPVPIPGSITNKALKNLVISSKTGSGKTLSYLLPILNDLYTSSILGKEKEKEGNKDTKDPRNLLPTGTILIMLPTRELAQQTHAQFVLPIVRKLAARVLVPLLLCGGGGGGRVHSKSKNKNQGETDTRKSEKKSLTKGAPILIGTPGRILDHCLRTSAIWGDDNLIKFGLEKCKVRLRAGAASEAACSSWSDTLITTVFSRAQRIWGVSVSVSGVSPNTILSNSTPQKLHQLTHSFSFDRFARRSGLCWTSSTCC